MYVYGPCGPGPRMPLWAPTGPLWAPLGARGPLGPSWAKPLWAPWALMGPGHGDWPTVYKPRPRSGLDAYLIKWICTH